MNPLKIIKYQLYLLQLENYELGRYFRLLWKKGFWPRGEQRKELVWTVKAGLLFFLAIVTYLALVIFVFSLNVRLGFSVSRISYLVFCIALSEFFFILYTLYTILLWPFDYFAKQLIVARAKAKLKNFPDIKIIGVAGSYGKTTMKEVLKEVLGVRFKVLGTPESVNTPVGIARWILNKVTLETEVLIIEMGEHYKGDVEEICNIVKPDVAVVTGINQAHLERMKTLENITDTIFEIVSSAKPGALVVLNGDDKNVEGNYKKYVWPDHKLEFFGKNSSSVKSKVKSVKFDAINLYWNLEINGIGSVNLNLLGEYALGDVSAAVTIAKYLGLNAEQIKLGIEKIKPVEHRLEPIRSAGDILVIDDAYNGNPAGVAEAIKVLSRFSDRRKVFITPGLVEMGKYSPEIHREIGRQLAGVADVVMLIKNSVTPWVEEGLVKQILIPELVEGSKFGSSTSSDAKFSSGDIGRPQVVWFNTAQEAHQELKNILKPGDVLLFQNDWGDQYI